MTRDHFSWHSPSLGRTMELLWFGWRGLPLILFPTSAGRFWENEDRSLVGSLAGKIENGEVQAICVDAINQESWFDESIHPGERVRRQGLYDSYLRNELVPYIQRRANRHDVGVYGASFGAYQAANFAARHPDVVSVAICFSGIFDISRYLHGFWDEHCYFQIPTAYIPNMSGEQAARLATIRWVIATGEGDSLAGANAEFSAMLGRKGIPNHLEIWPGVFGHDWPWWKEHLPRFV